jgi:uncharacterized membrane protein
VILRLRNSLNSVSFRIRIFIVLQATALLTYLLVTPPLQTPDEFNHFMRAWQVSEGDLLPVKKVGRLGGEIPWSVTDFFLPYSLSSTSLHKVTSEELGELLRAHPDEGERAFRDFPNTAYYSPVSYLPQAAVIFVFRKLNASPLVIYYAGRVFMILLWLLATSQVLRWLDGHRRLFAALMSLPMTLYLVNSFSADTVTNLLAFLFLALVIRFRKGCPGWREMFALAAVSILLAQAKLVYSGLLLLLFVIPSEGFSSRLMRHLFVTGIFMVSTVLAMAWSDVILEYYISDQEYNPAYRQLATLGYKANYFQQLDILKAHPLGFVSLFFGSLFDPVVPYWAGYIGSFGAFLGLNFPGWMYLAGYLSLFTLALDRNKLELKRSWAFLLVPAFVLSLALLLLSQHLTWDEVGSDRVWLLQGRYFIPLFPLLFLLFSRIPLRLPPAAIVISAGFILVLHVVAFKMLAARYVMDPFQKKACDCGAENLSPSGAFACVKGWEFTGSAARTSDTVRTGKFAAISSPQHAFVFQKRIDSLRTGDLVEAELWKRGKGASVVLYGESGCRLYLASDRHDYTDRNGWDHMHFIYQLPDECRVGNFVFFIHNPAGGNVYIDDLRMTIRRKQQAR